MRHIYVFSELNLKPNKGQKFVKQVTQKNIIILELIIYGWMDKGHILLKYMQRIGTFSS